MKRELEREIEMSRENVIYNALSIGTVEKGLEPSASITGKGGNQVLNLVLPKGDKGDKGDATLIDITAGKNVTLEKQGETIVISSSLGSQDEEFQAKINKDIEDLKDDVSKKVDSTGYVSTDNNYSNDEKEKVNKAYASILKAYTITLLSTNWTLNETTNLYEYNVIKEDITENTYIRVIGDSVNREKLSDLDVNSYDGYYILTTTDEPKENVDVTVYYQLTVSANTVDNSAENTDNVDAGGVDNVGEE